jgi:hypothetical protein
VAQRIGAVAGATLGSLFCFVMGWWAARRADGRFETHGLLTGAAAGFLTALGAVFGPPGQAVYYIVAVLMKLFAGRAGGRMAAKMAAEARGAAVTARSTRLRPRSRKAPTSAHPPGGQPETGPVSRHPKP